MQQSPLDNYFGTSFHPSGNHYLPQCAGAVNGGVRMLREPRLFVEPLESPNKLCPGGVNNCWMVGGPNGQFLAYGKVVEDDITTFARYVFGADDDTVNNNNNKGNETAFDVPEDGGLLLETRPFYAFEQEGLLIPYLELDVGVSPYSASVPLPNGGRLASMADANGILPGELKQFNFDDVTSESLSQVDAPLKDATISFSKNNQQWAVYHGSTAARYVHGALGDNYEAHKLSILYWNGTTERVERSQTISLPGNTPIFEGLAPMWADLDGDGIDDLVTTVATAGKGAQLRAYLFGNECNNATDGGSTTSSQPIIYQAAESDYIGTSSRWLHQLGVGPLGPNGETEIVQCMTPHIGGIIRYHRLVKDGNNTSQLEQVHAIGDGRTYTTHQYRSRNLDQVTIGDFNNDGIPEVVLTDFRQTKLVGLQRTVDGTKEVWSVDMPEFSMTSNIAVSCSGGGGSNSTTPPMLLFTTPNHLVRVVFEPSGDTVTATTSTSSLAETSRQSDLEASCVDRPMEGEQPPSNAWTGSGRWSLPWIFLLLLWTTFVDLS